MNARDTDFNDGTLNHCNLICKFEVQFGNVHPVSGTASAMGNVSRIDCSSLVHCEKLKYRLQIYF